MSKRLYFLISFVLVLSLSGLAQAGTPIVVDNNSFEYDCNGVEVTCHTGHITTPGEQCDAGIAAWRYLGAGWTGVDVNCGTEDVNCTTCKEWLEFTDGTAHLFFMGNASVHQILDFDIVYGHKYTATMDLLAFGDDIVIQFFALEDVCYPDVNHLEISTTVIPVTTYVDTEGSGRNVWMKDQKAIGVVADMAMVGKKLGIKIGGDYLIGGTNTDYLWADYVRVEYEWASNAYDPDPPDGAGDVNSQALTLSWLPGLWAVSDVNGHEVYFGTSWADVNSATTATTGIYRGTGVGVVSGPDGNDRYSYVIPGGDLPFALGETYFWRIDEVNDDYVGPIPKPWKGDVWSFDVEGRAKAVYPADGAEDIPALNLLLYWEAGVGAGSHDVYFGTSKADVTDANTANTALYPGVFRGNQIDVNDPNYPVEDLGVGVPYFWRIDEVNTISGTFVEGHVWSFTTGVFLIVDSFEWYQTHKELRAVWKDLWSGSLYGLNGAEVFLEMGDPNMILGGEQSMLYYFMNFNKKAGVGYVGSEVEAALPLEVGTDWTVGGVKALVMYFYGDPCNLTDTTGVYGDIHQDQMYVALEDGDANVGIVKLPDMGDIKQPSWHTWNISLQDPNFSDVNMANVAKIYIGFGGQKMGQTKAGAGDNSGRGDTVWFDEIRLYPPRCMPAMTGKDVLRGLGDIGGGEEGAQDCNTDYSDLDIMARDWASIDGLADTENRPAVLTDFPDETSHWTTDCAVGTGAIEVNDGYNIDVTDPRLRGLTSMSMTCWVQRSGTSRDYESLVSSREYDVGCGDDATELGIYQNEVGYDWSCGGEQWQWSSDLIVPADSNWAFIAVSVDPTGASAYLKTSSGALETSRNAKNHPPQQNFVDDFTIGNNDKSGRDYFPGKIDDVRIYGYALDDANIALLANETGEPNPPPVYWYKFDETEGLSAADYGTPIQVYTLNMSPANLVPKDPCDSEDPNLGTGAFDPNNMDIINFLDYSIMAEHWLEGPFLWPAQP